MSGVDDYRPVYCRLVDDPDFQALPPGAQRLWFFLRVSPECGPTGLFRWYPELHRARASMTKRAFGMALEALQDARWVLVEAGYLLIRNAMRYEPSYRPDRDPKHMKHLLTTLEPLRRLRLARQLLTENDLAVPDHWPEPGAPEGAATPTAGASEGHSPVTVAVTVPVTVTGGAEGPAPGPCPSPDIASMVTLWNAVVVQAQRRHFNARNAKVPQQGGPLHATLRGAWRWCWQQHKDYPLRTWEEYCDQVAAAPFLIGAVRDWHASLQWAAGPKNREKVTAGNYDDHKAKPVTASAEHEYPWHPDDVEVMKRNTDLSHQYVTDMEGRMGNEGLQEYPMRFQTWAVAQQLVLK